MIVFICLAQALELIQDFPSVFYLSENEFSAVELPDYFSGNEIWFDVSPENDQVHLRQSGLEPLHSMTVRNKIQKPIKTNLVVNIELIGTSSSQFAIYASGSEIYLFDSNQEEFLAWNIHQDILSYTLIQSDVINGVVLLSHSWWFQKNLLWFSSISFVKEKMLLGTPLLITCLNCDFEEFNPGSAYISNGLLYKSLAITGYIDSTAYFAYYSIDLITMVATQISLQILGNFSVQSTIFTVTSMYKNYVFVPQTNNLINYELIVSRMTLNLTSSVNLTEFEIVVTDMRLSNDLNHLLLGIEDGIMIINQDFTEIYIDKFLMNISNVQVTSSKENIYLLLQNSNINLLKVIRNHFSFYEIGFINLNISENCLGWGIYNSSLTGFSLVLNKNRDLITNYIRLSAPYLNVTSAEKTIIYTLNAYENSTDKNLSFNFLVSRPSPLGIIEYMPDIYFQTAIFSGLKSEVELKLYDYFCGSCIELISIELVNSSDLFSMTYDYKSTINYQTATIKSDLNWVQGIIISSDTNVFFYNSSSIRMLLDSDMVKGYNFDDVINKIYTCSSKYLFDVTSGGLNYLVLNYNLNEIDIKHGTQYVSFSDIQCSGLFVTALNTSGLYLFKIVDYTLEYVYVFNQTVQNSPMLISSFYQNENNYVCAIVNDSLVMMFNIEGNGFYPLNFPLIQFSVRLDPLKIFCYQSEFYYVAFKDSSISIFNEYAKLIRTFYYQLDGELFFTDQFIITTSNYLLQVFDSRRYTCNVLIAEYLIPDYSHFSYSTESNLNLYFLTTRGELMNLSILKNYSTAFISFSFKAPENISEVLYEVDLNVTLSNLNNSLSNFYQEISQLVPLNLFTNGETIFKNSSNVKLLQNELKDLDCEKTSISLEKIFTGQDLILTLEDPSKTLSVHQRISEKQNVIKIQQKFSALLPIKSTETFIFANHSYIWLLDIKTEDISEIFIKEGDNEVDCTSLALIYLKEHLVFKPDIIFSAGCSITNNEGKDQVKSYALYFFLFNSVGLKLLQKVDLAYEASLMSCSSTIGGKFVVMITDIIPNYMHYDFACNHFQIVAGYVEDLDVKILLTSYLSPISLEVNYYYIIDFVSFFDPMFKVFYLYLLDWHYGIRIIKIDQISPIFQYRIENIKLINAVALTKCGRMMIISYDNTTIIKYFMEDWFRLKYKSQIYLYKSNYHAIPSTLECSSFVYSNYLLMLIQDDQLNTYLHIINNRATELSSIIADVLVYQEYDGVYAFFDEVDNIAVITPQEFFLYQINENYLEINPTGKCDDGVKEKVLIKATNLNGVNSFCTLELEIKKNYDSGNVSGSALSFWIWIIIGGFITGFILIGIKFALRYSGRKNKKKHNEGDLFDYEFSEAIN
jgi:hypothetical protein